MILSRRWWPLSLSAKTCPGKTEGMSVPPTILCPHFRGHTKNYERKCFKMEMMTLQLRGLKRTSAILICGSTVPKWPGNLIIQILRLGNAYKNLQASHKAYSRKLRIGSILFLPFRSALDVSGAQNLTSVTDQCLIIPMPILVGDIPRSTM